MKFMSKWTFRKIIRRLLITAQCLQTFQQCTGEKPLQMGIGIRAGR